MNQVRLIGAIAKHLESQGVKDMNVRQMNAIIDAADAIIAKLPNCTHA